MTAETDTEKMAQSREAFEKWAKERGYSLVRNVHGYTDETTLHAFFIWQAARAPASGKPNQPPNDVKVPTEIEWLCDELAAAKEELMFLRLAQPASVADRYRQIGWVHPVYLDQHMGAGALAIEVSQPRLSDAQIPVFVRAAAPQSPAIGHVGKSHKGGE